MKRLFSNLIGLAIFIAIAGAGIGYYINIKAVDAADQTINMFKKSGFNLSQYDEISIDYFKRSASLKNLHIAGDEQDWLKLDIAEVQLSGIDPISDFEISVKNIKLIDIDLTYNGDYFQIETADFSGLKLAYQPHFTPIMNAENLNDKVRLFHNEIGYDSVSFEGFSLTDAEDNITYITEGSYTKTSLINSLPNVWNAHLSGMKINRAHLPPEYAKWLNDYKIKELNGILDVSFDYQTQDRYALFAINNLNFGGLANLQADIRVAMTDERLYDFFNLENLDENLNKLPIEHAQLEYDDLGLYNYFITQQAELLETDAPTLKAKIYFGLLLASGQIKDLDKRRELITPLADFHNKPAGLKVNITPEKPVRFQHYLNIYDADILIRDLNPSVEYIIAE